MSKGNILLIYPGPIFHPRSESFPLSLLYISTLLSKNGYNVDIIDQRFEIDFYSRLDILFKEKQFILLEYLA